LFLFSLSSAASEKKSLSQPLIVRSYLRECNISGNARVIEESESNFNFGNGYISSEPNDIDFTALSNSLINKSYNVLEAKRQGLMS
jgi:hypothetical protein